MSSQRDGMSRSGVVSRGGLLYLAATTLANALNFAFHSVVSHQVGPARYGAISALLNIVTIVSVPLLALQTSVVQAFLARDGQRVGVRKLLQRALVIGIAVAMALVLVSPLVASYLKLGSILPVAVLSTWFVTALAAIALGGVLIGQLRFAICAVAVLAGAVVRLALGYLLGRLTPGIEGALIATSAAGVVTLGIVAWALRSHLRIRRPQLRVSAGALTWSLVALSGIAALVGVDTVLARHLYGSILSGRYAAAATAAHIAMYASGALGIVVFPRFVNEKRPTGSRDLVVSCALAGAIGLVTAIVLLRAQHIVIDLLFGSRFEGFTGYGILCVESAVLGVGSVLVYYVIARRPLAAVIPWISIAVVVGWAELYRPRPILLAWSMLAAASFTVVFMTTLVAVAPIPRRARAHRRPGAAEPLRPLATTYELDFPLPHELDLSLVIPYYNPGLRLRQHVGALLEVLRRSSLSFEVIAVSDGTRDGSDNRLEDLGSEISVVRLRTNRGKGAALRTGFIRGRGRYLGFIDGDGDIPAGELERFISLIIDEGPDMAIGSKWHPGSDINASLVRRIYSLIFQGFVRVLTRVDVTDTQAGLKLIRRELLLRTLPVLQEKGFLLDLELLALARRLGYSKIAELPIRIGDRLKTTISPRIAIATVARVFVLSWRLYVSHQYTNSLQQTKQRSVLEAAAQSAARASPPRRLRVLLCNWRDLAHPAAGGAEVWTHEVATALVESGHAVTVFCAEVSGRPSSEVIDGVRYLRRGSKTGVYREARSFYRREGRGRFDLVIDEVSTRPFGCARWVKDAPSICVVHQLAREVWFYEMPLPVAFAGRYVLERHWLRSIRRARVLAVSESTKKSLREIGIQDVRVVPEGFRAPPLSRYEKEEQPTVCWVGRLAANKRPDHAVRAFALAKASLPDAKLWVIGSGPMQAALERSAPPDVHFFGRVDDDKKLELLGRSHAVMATSVREGWGLTVTEAAAVGTPAIGYAVPGLIDSITASGGYVVAPSVEELGDELVRRLPRFVEGETPAVHPGGVVPWAEVVRRLFVAAGEAEGASLKSPGPLSDPALDEKFADPGSRRFSDPWLASSSYWRQHSRRMRRHPALRRDRVAGLRGFALFRWSLAAVGVVALAGTAATTPYAWLSERLANVALFALGAAALLLFVETWKGRQGRGSWLPLRGTVSAWRRTTLFVAGAATLVCQSWFVPGGAIAGGDIAPPEGTAWLSHLFVPYVWSGANLGGPANYEVQLPWAGVLWIVTHVGGSAVLAQRVWITLLVLGAALAALYLLRLLGCGPGASAVGALAYVLNAHVVSAVAPNTVYLAALVLFPAVPALILAATRRRLPMWAAIALFAGSAPLVGYAYQNPPLVLPVVAAIIVTVLLAALLGGREGARRAAFVALSGALLLVIAGSYWIIPAFLQVHEAAVSSLASSSSWTWTESRSTTANAFWLNTDWGWSYDYYYPFAPNYSAFPLVLLRFLPPIAAFAALLLPSSRGGDRIANKRLLLVAVIASCSLLLIALSTGTNPPGSVLFDRLYSLPFGWLLREPGRFLLVVALCYAALIAIGVDALARGVKAVALVDFLTTSRLRKATAGAACAALIVAPGYPLITGQIVPSSRGIFPSDHVELPKYWTQMASVVNGLKQAGAVLVLPTDDFYQMPYKWGYYGNDGFIVDLIRRPVLDPALQGYTPSGSALYSDVRLVSSSLLFRQWRTVETTLAALRVRYVLVRGDIDSSFPGRQITSPALLVRALHEDPEMHLAARAGPLQLYMRGASLPPPLANQPPVFTPQQSPDLEALALLPAGSALVTSRAVRAPFLIQLPAITRWTMTRRTLVEELRVPRAQTLSVGKLSPRRPALVRLDRGKETIAGVEVRRESSNLLRFAIRLGPSVLRNSSQADGGWGTIQDCAAFNPNSAVLRARLVSSSGRGPVIELSAVGDRACVSRPVAATGPVLISLDTRALSGAGPELCLWELPARRCASLPSLSTSTKWRRYRAVAEIPSGQRASLFLYAPTYVAGAQTVVEFASVSVRRLLADPPTLDVVGVGGSERPSGEQLWVASTGANSGWRSSSGTPVTVDGLLSGWLTASREKVPRLSYAPEAFVTASELASLVASLVVVLLIIVGLTIPKLSRRRKARNT